MTLKKILIYLALVLPLCLSAQNYADYKLYASYDFEQGVIDRQANTSLELKNGARIVEDAVRGKVLYFSGDKCQHAVMVPHLLWETQCPFLFGISVVHGMILRLVGNRSLNSIIPLTVAIFILCLYMDLMIR